MLMPDVEWHLETVVAPTEEPIHFQDVRDQHLRVVNGTAEDGYLESLVIVAREWLEGYCHRAVPLQTLDLVMDTWPVGDVVIPMPPLLSVESMLYTDSAGTVTVWDAANYQVSMPSGPTATFGRVRPVSGGTWPTVRAQMDAVRVRFRCGYLDESVSPAVPTVPARMIQAMRVVIGELYKQRSVSVQDVSQQPAILSAEALVDVYRMIR